MSSNDQDDLPPWLVRLIFLRKSISNKGNIKGVTKTYKLTYESVEIMRALFDRNTAKNRWIIGAYVLKSYSEYFGVKTEQLDLYHEGGRVTFTSYTEKIMDGNGWFKVYRKLGGWYRLK